jgi:hypothetical protein
MNRVQLCDGLGGGAEQSSRFLRNPDVSAAQVHPKVVPRIPLPYTVVAGPVGPVGGAGTASVQGAVGKARRVFSIAPAGSIGLGSGDIQRLQIERVAVSAYGAPRGAREGVQSNAPPPGERPALPPGSGGAGRGHPSSWRRSFSASLEPSLRACRAGYPAGGPAGTGPG